MAEKKAPKKAIKKESVRSKEARPDEEEPPQPEINIGLVGHVDHGKTTLVKAFTGKWTDTHSEEMKRGITIRLGYANADIRLCDDKEKPACYTTEKTCSNGRASRLLRKISFVDAPGHESLMATMLSGATIMDGALVLISANESCPQPQTREHIMALEMIGIDKVIFVQNKIDVVSEERAVKNYGQIRDFIKNSRFKDAPIIPVSAQHSVNTDLLLQAIEEHIPTPKRSDREEPIMLVARSFDINRPGTPFSELKGGVLGGVLLSGNLRTGDTIEIRPGYMVETQNQKVWRPITTKVRGLLTGNTPVDSVHPGGSIGILTTLDPSIVKSDILSGSVVGKEGKLPPVHDELLLETHLLDRVVGSKEDIKVEPIKLHELLMLNVNAAATVGQVTKLGKSDCTCKLKLPVCAETGSRVTISRKVGNRFRLIGYGLIK